MKKEKKIKRFKNIRKLFVIGFLCAYADKLAQLKKQKYFKY